MIYGILIGFSVFGFVFFASNQKSTLEQQLSRAFALLVLFPSLGGLIGLITKAILTNG